jgi:polar amino acid transport system substrate-binding protein
MLPDVYKSRGTLIAVSAAASPPRASTDDKGNIVGAIPDIVAAAAARLGLKMDLQLAQFSAEVPGVQSGRYDITTDTGDFATRRAAVDLIDYYRAGVALIVKTGNSKNIHSPADLCGLALAVTKGATQEVMAQNQSKTCVSQGKKAIDILPLDTTLTVPLEAGRVDAAWDNSSTAALVTAQSPTKFALAGEPQWLAPLAFGVRKDNTQFRDALVLALQSLVDDGIYGAILAKWNQSICALTKITVNGSTF